MLTVNRHDPGMSARGRRAPEVAVQCMPTEEILAAKKGKDVIEKSNTARSLRHCCGNLDTTAALQDRPEPRTFPLLSYHLVLPTTTSMSAVHVFCHPWENSSFIHVKK